MNLFWFSVYNYLALPVARIAVFLASLAHHDKMRIMVKGRQKLFPELEQKLKSLKRNGLRFWIHSSSMGEFEQARPLVTRLKECFPDSEVVMTVYSLSAMEYIKNYTEADILCYMPFDIRDNARRFVSLVRPDMAILVRHDFWPNHLDCLRRAGIPNILINSSFRTKYATKLKVKSFTRFLYSYFDLILTVSDETKLYIQKNHLTKVPVDVVGDTKYDQVVRRAREAESVVAPLRNMKGTRKSLILGSIWPSDEAVLFPALKRLFNEGIKPWLVLVPHEITEGHLNQIEEQLESMGLDHHRFSELDSGASFNADAMVVDRFGILAALYALGDLCYVGGSFGPGIHNVLEPAALGKVILFGPRHENSQEAVELKNNEVGFAVEDDETLFNYLYTLFHDSDKLVNTGRDAADLVRKNLGATDRIIKHIENILPAK